MTPFLLYCWMALFVQLLIPSIVNYVVMYTNCNTILSIYLPIILSMVLLHRDGDDSVDGVVDGKDSDDDVIISDPTDAETTKTTTVVASTTHRKSQRLQSQQRLVGTVPPQKENAVNGRRTLTNTTSTKKGVKNVASSNSQLTTQDTNRDLYFNHEIYLASDTSTTTTSTAVTTTTTATTVAAATTPHTTTPSIRQLLLQYWIIVRMVAALTTAATHSIPSWIRRMTVLIVGIGMSSSVHTHRIYSAHLEFYLYGSLYIIPLITPTVVQEMMMVSSNNTKNNENKSNNTAPPTGTTTPSTKTPTKHHHKGSDSDNSAMTLIQFYYIQYYIEPFVTYIYNTMSSTISVSTYESYIIAPTTKFLSVASYMSIVSEPTCHYLTQLIHDGRTILIPSIITLFVQSYPIQYLFVLYISYIVPIHKCCADIHVNTIRPLTTKQRSTTLPSNVVVQPHRTTHQWLQYWVIQTILTSTIQSLSSLLYWIPFSTTLLYAFYVYVTVILSPTTISYFYDHYIQHEIQYLIHFFDTSSQETKMNSKTARSTSDTNKYSHVSTPSSSRTIQLWNYILDHVPKAQMEETTHSATNTASHIDDDETHEIIAPTTTTVVEE